MSTQVYQLSGGGTAALPNKPIISPRDPTTTDIVDPNGSPYQILQAWRNTASGSVWEYTGGGVWTLVASSSGGPIETINTNAPVAANYTLAGTANQIAVAQTTGTSTFSLVGPYTPATYTAHGVLIGEGTSSIVATAAGTTGQVLTATTSADPAFAAIGTNSGLTAHGVLIAEGTGAFAATAAGSSGQFLVSGGASADPTWQTATPQLVIVPVAGTSQAMTSNHTYIANAATLTTFTLPATSAVGDIISIIGSALNTGGWKVTYTTGQIIWGPAGSSTITTGNAASAAAAAQAMSITCVVANTTWVITNNSGTITLT